MERKLEVVEYDIDTLTRLLSDLSEAKSHVVESKLHRLYFSDYFKELGARTIVVEREYVDRDFLEDFAAYYVRCFRRYRRTCGRLHFFSESFDAEALEDLLCGRAQIISAEQLDEKYLGFVVVKPLPETIIGRTCLSTYEPEGRRFYPARREHRAHLFGVPLTVETVAFQEQDKVVAACATSALWSVFQCTAQLFGHAIPSPVAITRWASERASLDTRALPSDGLTTVQMAEAIRKAPLEPYLVNAEEPHILQNTVYAYLRAGIPMMLAADLYGIRDEGQRECIGHHAVAITGYSTGSQAAIPHAELGTLLRASRIDKFYAHDDQVGPFARMGIDRCQESAYLTTSWGHKKREYKQVNAAPKNLLVPLYHKIRIPLVVVLNTLIPFDWMIEQLRQQGFVRLRERIEWDVYLTKANELKEEIAKGMLPIGDVERRDLLLQSMPRFVWRATGYDVDDPVLDLLFDATDIEQGSFLYQTIEYDQTLSTVVRSVVQDEAIAEQWKSNPAWQVIEWFVNSR